MSGWATTWSGRESPPTSSEAMRRRPKTSAPFMPPLAPRSRWSGRSTTSPSPDSPMRSATSAIAAQFQYRAQFWRNVFNPATGYIAPRDADGAFLAGPGFVASSSDYGQDGFDEGNAEQYLWFVPQNIAGLVTAVGGHQVAAERLDRLTTQLNVGPNEPYLWIGNEPSFGVPWLYNYVGQPWKTQQLVDRVRSQLFGPTPGGEPGNDDLGALSSWYVWAALGLYPITPGTAILTVNTPLFDRAEIALPAGKSIRISAPGASNGRKFIDGLSIDGQPTDQTFLPESMIRSGGDVTFSLSAIPNLACGALPSPLRRRRSVRTARRGELPRSRRRGVSSRPNLLNPRWLTFKQGCWRGEAGIRVLRAAEARPGLRNATLVGCVAMQGDPLKGSSQVTSVFFYRIRRSVLFRYMDLRCSTARRRRRRCAGPGRGCRFGRPLL